MKLPSFIKDNLLLKITSLNSAAISVRLVLAFASQKIVAELLGPAGVAQIGNLRNIIPMIESFSTLGVFNGIVKYVAEHKDDEEELNKLFSTSFVYMLLASLVAFVMLFFGANFLNDLVFKGGQDYVFVFKILAVSVPFIAMNRVFNGIINGLSAYKKFVKVNLVTYALSVVLLVVMVLFENIQGALLAIAITPILQFSLIFYLYYVILKDYLSFKELKFSIPYKNKLFAFTLMSLVSTFLASFIDINLRNNLVNQISEVDAGNWTGMTNISKQYLMFTTAILTLYVIPKFAVIKTSKDFRLEVFNIYKTLLPLFAIGMLLIFVCREWVILIAKSDEFLGMKPLFKWQLLGDFIRVASIIVAHQFLAKKMVKQFIFTEILSLGLFYGFSSLFIKTLGAEGVVLAHFIRYVIYFLVVLIILRKHIFGNNIIIEE